MGVTEGVQGRAKEQGGWGRGGVGTRFLTRLPHPPIRALVYCPGMGAAEAALVGGALAA